MYGWALLMARGKVTRAHSTITAQAKPMGGAN
jgi:hypothetical protein